MIRVLAIIVDYASHEDATELSLQLAALPREGFELTVAHVDNASPVPHVATPEQKAGGVVCLRPDSNDGYSGGINAAVAALDPAGDRFDAYFYLNADLRLEPGCLRELVRVLEQQPRVGAVGPRVFFEGSDRVWGSRGVVSPLWGLTAMRDWPEGGPLPRWSYLPGCSILARASVYRELGGMPARYRLYFEETEFCVRLQRAGYDLWVEPRAIARHRVDSLRHGIPARHFAFYFARNNLYFWRECFGIPWAVQLPRTLFVVAKELVLPLRRARSLEEARDRARYIAAGVLDGFEFLRNRYTSREKKLFLGQKK